MNDLKPGRGRPKGYKLVDYEKILYSFRLKTTKEQQPYIDQLDTWLAQRPDSQPKDTRMVEIICGLMDAYGGREIPTGGDIADLINKRFDHLESVVQKRVDEVLRTVIQNPRAMEKLNHLSQQHTDGEEIDDDLIANMLEDFGREG